MFWSKFFNIRTYVVLAIIHQLSYYSSVCANSLHYTDAMFGMIPIRFWPGLYTKAYTESYKI